VRWILRVGYRWSISWGDLEGICVIGFEGYLKLVNILLGLNISRGGSMIYWGCMSKIKGFLMWVGNTENSTIVKYQH
jgi:hypothetical protein